MINKSANQKRKNNTLWKRSRS